MNYINEIPRAIKNGIIVPELKGYHCIHDPNPNHRWDFIWASGGFCQVYPLIKEGSSKKNLRLWKSSEMMEDLGYVARLAEYFSNHNIKYVKPYRYYEHALMLNNGVVIPGVVMDWVEGETLIKYVGKHCGEPRAIQDLATQFYTMVNYLNNNNMAHGDLSGDNIIVNADGSLCLIDYDSFYVPGFENVKQSIKGTKGYRHPERQNDIFMSRTMDYFSQQVIYLSLLATAQNPKLGSLFNEKELLFTESDLQNLNNYKNSKGYQALTEIHDPVIRLLTEELGRSISGPLNKVKSIVEIVSDNYKDATPPKPIPCASVNNCINGSIDLIGGPLGTKYNNKLYAKPGDKISILVFPNHTYKLKEIKVLTPSGIWRLGVQKHFIMPNCDVSVEAEFEKAYPDFKELNFCTKCNTRFYKPYSNYCHHCGKKRL